MRRAVLALAALALVAAAPPTLPTIAGTSADGAPLELAPARHEVTVIHFWATWCAPCRVEMPMLARQWRAHRGQGLAVLGVALDSGASRAKIAGAAGGIPVARLADVKLPHGLVPRALPETLVYGRDGRLRYRFGNGGPPLDEATLARIVPPLLAER